MNYYWAFNSPTKKNGDKFFNQPNSTKPKGSQVNGFGKNILKHTIYKKRHEKYIIHFTTKESKESISTKGLLVWVLELMKKCGSIW